MKRKIILTAIIICMAWTSIGLFFYPEIKNMQFEKKVTAMIATYAEKADNGEFEEDYLKATEYNNRRNDRVISMDGDNSKLDMDYEEMLSSAEMMGYIIIPTINVELPIYHGTSKDTLLKGVGHLESTDLPVGGIGTHCVLSGHTGMSNAELFNNLTELELGDYFHLFVAGHQLTYRIDNIDVVLPEDTRLLYPVKDKDYCTLVTCTPYAVNTHRLLVRGVRVNEDDYKQSSDLSRNVFIDNKETIIKIVLLMMLSVVLVITYIWHGGKNEKK